MHLRQNLIKNKLDKNFAYILEVRHFFDINIGSCVLTIIFILCLFLLSYYCKMYSQNVLYTHFFFKTPFLDDFI